MSADRIVKRLLIESPAPVEAPPRPAVRPGTAPRPSAPPPVRRPWKAPPYIRPGSTPRPKARHPYRYDEQAFAESVVQNQIAGWLRSSEAVYEDWSWDNAAQKLTVTLQDGSEEFYTREALAKIGVLTEKKHKAGCTCWFCKKKGEGKKDKTSMEAPEKEEKE